MDLSLFNTYPLPQVEADLNATQKRVSAQHEGIIAVLESLSQALDQRMQEQQDGVTAVTSALKRKIKSAITSQQKQLDPVTMAMAQQASAAVTSDQIALTNAAAEIGKAQPIKPVKNPPPPTIIPRTAPKFPLHPIQPPAQPIIPNPPTPPPNSLCPVDQGTGCPQGMVPADGTFAVWRTPGGPVVVSPAYCYTPLEQGGPDPIFQNPPSNTTGEQTTGTYSSAEEAWTAAGGCQPQPVPPIPPQPPQPPEPPVYPPPTDEQWYCVIDNYSNESAVVLGPPDPGLYPIPRWVIDGPFPTQQQAAFDCQAKTTPLPPPTQPQPSPITPVTPPGNVPCSNFPLYGSVIPVPGTQDWCDVQSDLRAYFSMLGKAIWQSIMPEVPGGWLDAFVGSGPTTPQGPLGPLDLVAAGIVTALQGIANLRDQLIKPYTDFMVCIFQSVANQPWCNASEVLALSFCRTAINVLSDLHVGWDIAVWATTHIKFEVGPIVKCLDYLINSACMSEIPDESTIHEMWRYGLISDDFATCLFGMHGRLFDPKSAYALVTSEKLDTEDAIQYGLRFGYSTDEIRGLLRRAGTTDPIEQNKQLNMYFKLPSISDHLHWLQRNVFDDEYVKDYRLMDGFDERFWEKFGPDLTALGMQKKYAALHYAAHWINPSPGQLAEMVQRLRPGRVDDDLAFTERDFIRILAEQDVAPYFRERLLAIAYHPLNLSDLRGLYGNRTIDDAQFLAALQDIGYAEDNAKLIRDNEKKLTARRRATLAHGYTPSRIARLYPLGLVDDRIVDNALTEQGFSGEEIVRLKTVSQSEYRANILRAGYVRQLRTTITNILSAYQSGAASAQEATSVLSAFGLGGPVAAGLLQSQELVVRSKLVQRAVNAARRAYLRGDVNRNGAQNLLNSAGLDPVRQTQYLADFDLERTVERQRLSTERIVRFVKRGLISPQEARVRLLNLGWIDPDAILILKEVEQQIGEQQQKLSKAQQAQGQKQQRELENLLKKNQNVHKSLISALRKATPVSKLQRWFANHLISEQYFRDRMALLEYPPDSIELWFQEAVQDRAKVDEKAAKTSGSKPTSTTP